jgi:peptidoglycan/LPS O-acetylase OafA/YrhL
MNEKSSTSRIASLDGLRALSIVLVFLGHTYTTRGYPNNSLTEFLGGFSHFGVQIFFVISGFLITSLLLRERSVTGRIDLPSFFLRRTFRIIPAALVYIAFATTLRFILHHPFPLKYLVYALTYTVCYSQHQPWVLAHLWSLSVEEQFYLFWPFALVIGFGIRKKTCWSVMILSPIARMLYQRYSPGLTEYAFPAVADCLAAGCLLALYAPELKRLPKWVYGVPSAAAIVIAASASSYVEHLSPLVWGIIPMMIAAAIQVLVTRRDWILNNPVLTYVGGLSYTLYLFQQPFLIQSYSQNRWSSFPWNWILALSFALGAHYLVEKPMLKVGRLVNERLLTPHVRRREAVIGEEVSA